MRYSFVFVLLLYATLSFAQDKNDKVQIVADTLISPTPDDSWSLIINGIENVGGKKRKIERNEIIDPYIATRLGLDTLPRKPFVPTTFQVIKIEILRYHNVFSHSDTTINKQAVLDAVNKLRETGCMCGEQSMKSVPPLKWSDEVERVAFLHAKDMHLRRYYSHVTPEKKNLYDRLEKQNINTYICGENIARGYLNCLEAVEGWKKSPGHCENMLTPRYRYIGIAKCKKKYCMVLVESVN